VCKSLVNKLVEINYLKDIEIDGRVKVKVTL
jgi:hypothetical protein